MTTSRGSGASRHAMRLASSLALLAIGCASLRHVGSLGPRPATLVGEWVDVAATTGGATEAWQLDASGAAHTVSVRGGASDTTRTSLGRWFVRGDSDVRSDRALCFVRRPGREPASCFAFVLDTIADGAVMRQRLRLTDGERVADRVLIQEIPSAVRPPLS